MSAPVLNIAKGSFTGTGPRSSISQSPLIRIRNYTPDVTQTISTLESSAVWMFPLHRTFHPVPFVPLVTYPSLLHLSIICIVFLTYSCLTLASALSLPSHPPSQLAHQRHSALSYFLQITLLISFQIIFVPIQILRFRSVL